MPTGKLSILLIDDHRLIREVWSDWLLNQGGLSVLATCGDGREAVALAKDKRPGIVLLDINMVPLNGFEVLTMIRKLSPSSRIIGVSFHTEPVLVKKWLRLGAKGYLTKNSSQLDMLTAIEEVSNGKLYICQEMKEILECQSNDHHSEEGDIRRLSARELQITRLICAGNSAKEVAAELEIKTKTVEVHRYNIFKKLNLKNTISLIQYIRTHALEL